MSENCCLILPGNHISVSSNLQLAHVTIPALSHLTGATEVCGERSLKCKKVDCAFGSLLE
jgi:hypothetical protein